MTEIHNGFLKIAKNLANGLVCGILSGKGGREHAKKNGAATPSATILLIVIVVAVVFGVLFGAFELVGRYLEEREPEPEVVETDEPWHPTELIPGLPVNEYDADAFRWDGNYLVYDGPETAHRGH